MQRYDSRTALVVVDVQNDFADPAGSLAVAAATAIIPTVNDAVRVAADAGATVVYTQDWHPASTPHFSKDGGIWPVHCLAESWGAELHPSLVVAADAARVRKGVHGEDGYSGFTTRDPVTGETRPTELDSLLRERGIERIVVCGLATDYCVNATALDAIRLGYETFFLEEAVAAVNLRPGDGERATDAMVDAGCNPWVVPAR
ncbi:MAG: isochorismatase family protein [Candidatus Limnocylindrales bacterium]